MGAPASYYYDLADYDAVAVAQRLDLPILVLHGGRDYQVTRADLAAWTNGLGDDALIRAFPTLNHLFIEGSGRATPTEYLSNAGHVAAPVIELIAQWVSGQR